MGSVDAPGVIRVGSVARKMHHLGSIRKWGGGGGQTESSGTRITDNICPKTQVTITTARVYLLFYRLLLY